MLKPRPVPLAAVLLALASARGVQAQPLRAGAEFQVNTYTTSDQVIPRLAQLPGGGFVAVWTNGDYLTYGSVRAQRYDPAGNRLGGEFQVETYTTGRQRAGSVAADRKGNFVVVWTDYDGQDGSAFGMFGQLYDAAGNRRGAQFAVNTYTTGYQLGLDAAFDGNGNFLVVWSSSGGQDGSLGSIQGQRFDAAGNRRGGEFQVNSYTTGYQSGAAMGMASDGSFVVVWHTEAPGGFDIHGQRFTADAIPVGSEFLVNFFTGGNQIVPRVAVAERGEFVVVWRESDGANYGVFGQRFDSSAQPAGGRFQVNTYTTGNQTGAQVAIDAIGNFAVSWTTLDGSVSGIASRRFRADGTPRDAEFIVNGYTAGFQSAAHISSDRSGNLIVAYTDGSSRDGDLGGAFAQRFGGLRPTALAVDPTGNAVLQPEETVELRPSWRNSNGGPLAFAGTLGAFSGPAGGAYTIVDGTGDYGTVANGATGQCIGCYSVLVSAANRPTLHWDATVIESISPDALGQEKRWLLHVGDTFADVSPGSPFYRFIETLIHNGVTGGCSATSYCPSSNSSREQMAAFVLVAKEGRGYAPPACTTPVFSDVPASSPFCRWIEELFRRGIVSGCGGNNYCPSANVTREQMAVFVLRTLDPALAPPACVPPNIFDDVPETSPFCRWIEELARRGIVSGCGGANYCPTQPVTRQEMSVFIAATFGLTLYAP